ncbi:hypothetical protein E2562_031542, partial [Oryza meyeriana var. granulata]
MKDLEKATSLEVDESTIDGDVDLGGGLTAVGKKRKDGRGSVDENGGSTKRILRSNSMRLHVDSETAGGVALDVFKGDSLEKKHCDIIAEGDRGGVLTVDTCNAEEDREVIGVIVRDAVVEAVRCSTNNVESLGLAEVEVAEGNDLDTNIQESDGKIEKADDKMSTPSEEQNESGTRTSIGGINDSQENKGINSPCQGEVIDPSATANGNELSMGLSRSNLTSGRESIEQEDTVMCVSDDQKVENHCQFDDKHNEAETIDNDIMLTDCTNQKKGMDSSVNETKGDSTPDIVFIRRKSITRKTCEAKQVKSEDEVQFEKRVTRSAT